MLLQKPSKVGRNVESMKIWGMWVYVSVSVCVSLCLWMCSQQNTLYCVPERKKGEEDSNVNQISAPHANSNN